MNRVIVCGIAALLVGAGCKDETAVTEPPASPVATGYPGTVGELLGVHCLDCHGADAPAAGLRLDSWDEMIKGSDFGEAVIPFDSENSVLIEMVTKLVGGPHPAEQPEAPLGRVSHEDDTLGTAEVDTLITWVGNGARNDQGVVPYENSINRLYVCSQDADMISVIDVDAKVVIRNIDVTDLGYMVGSKPHDVEVAPDGQSWYVSLIAAGRVLKFDNTYQKTGESDNIPIPALLAANPAQNTIYVSRFMDFANIQESVFALDRGTMMGAPGEIPVLFDIPHCMAVSRSGAYAYTASLSQNQVIFINTVTNEADDFLPIGAGKGPVQMAVSPDDNTLYLSCQLSHQMLVIDVTDPGVRSVVDSIDVALNPWHPVYTPDGSHVYVGNFGGDVVTVINTSTRAVETTISGNGISQPHGSAASKNSPYVFVSSRNISGAYTPRYDFGDNGNVGTVVVINTTTNVVEKVIEIEEFGSGMAIWEQ